MTLRCALCGHPDTSHTWDEDDVGSCSECGPERVCLEHDMREPVSFTAWLVLAALVLGAGLVAWAVL